jgi:hypothetical protein
VGPPTIEGCLCCYQYVSGAYICGRPFVVDGVAVSAETVQRSDWLEARVAPPFDALDDATRTAIVTGWRDDARMEHASIASFARFTLDLLALGAPADLVEASHHAGLDEIAHARTCFALASRYAGEAIGPDVLPAFGATTRPSLVDAAVAAVKEGCVGETLAALIAAEQLTVARDDAARAALSRIAEDEARHAELAYRFVAWACEIGGAPARRAVADAFVAELEDEARRPRPREDASAHREALHDHGRLTLLEQDAVRRAGLREVIAPCADAFVGAARAPEARGEGIESSQRRAV